MGINTDSIEMSKIEQLYLAFRECGQPPDSFISEDDVIWSLEITIGALIEAGLKDDEIIRIVQKFYNVSVHVIQDIIIVEKKIESPCRNLLLYLVQNEAYTENNAHEFIKEHDVRIMLRHEKDIWKLSPEKLYEKALQKKRKTIN